MRLYTRDAIGHILSDLKRDFMSNPSFPKRGGVWLTGVVLLSLFCSNLNGQPAADARWSVEQAGAWYKSKPWPVGCNFIPSTAINELEMWQAETFDPATIDRELGWAEQLGFNSVRVFLHNLPWQEDATGFLNRMDQFLDIADRRHIGVMFVLFDSCWDPFPKMGRQRDPKPHVHNSGWVQCPGKEILMNPARQDELEGYVKGVVGRFKTDRRVLAWDVFNEPDNSNHSSYGKLEAPNKADLALMLLRKAFRWAREVAPSQPLTVGVWMGQWEAGKKLSPIEKISLEQSDIISFHNYGKPDDMRQCIKNLRRFHRPILCSEYMARPNGSTFDPILGILKAQKVGAFNWGFVSGKTQTIYAWDTWEKTYTAEPPTWFHDIFRNDGTPFDPKEVSYIKSVAKNHP
jgi:hypothetical protein